MSEYRFMEYEEVTKKIEDVNKVVLKFGKGDKKLAPQDLKDKLGDKTNMASLIISLVNVCQEAKDLLSKMHGHNFELRGKVAEMSNAAMKKMTAEMKDNQSRIMNNIADVKEHVLNDSDPKTRIKSFADVVGENGKALVSPMKQALKQIEKEEEKAVNVIVHGLDLNPGIKDAEKQKEHLKYSAVTAVIEALELGVDKEQENITSEDIRTGITDELIILGKVMDNRTGRAPPVMLKTSCVKIAQLTVKSASCLSRIIGLRRVYITPDLSKDEREKQKKLRADLKEKISEFPERHWVIRRGVVTSIGNYTRKRTDNGDDDKSLDRSYRF